MKGTNADVVGHLPEEAPIAAPLRLTPRFDLHEPPRFDDLVPAAKEALVVSRSVASVRERWVNNEGGDVGCSGSRRSLLRHTANYLAAADLAERHGDVRHTVDVGGGVGTLSVWLARRLGVPLQLVDAGEQVRAVAGAAFPDVAVHADLSELADSSADLVTAMEVIEHIEPEGQRGFVRELARIVAPGGMLVMSTPDERDYVGGWSGYAPHVGVLDAPSLHHLLSHETGMATTVWRLEGEPFELVRWRRLVMPAVNRSWHGLHRAAPDATGHVGHLVSAGITRLRGWRGPSTSEVHLHGSVRAVPAAEGSGTGLLAVCVR